MNNIKYKKHKNNEVIQTEMNLPKYQLWKAEFSNQKIFSSPNKEGVIEEFSDCYKCPCGNDCIEIYHNHNHSHNMETDFVVFNDETFNNCFKKYRRVKATSVNGKMFFKLYFK